GPPCSSTAATGSNASKGPSPPRSAPYRRARPSLGSWSSRRSAPRTGACSRSSTGPDRGRFGSSSRCRTSSPRFLLRLPQMWDRRRPLPASALAGQPLVDAPVRERVRLHVALAPDVLEPNLLELLDQCPRLMVEPLGGRVFHLPPTGELFDEQPAVRAQEHVGRAELARAFQPADRGGVLGGVVGRDADPPGAPVGDPPAAPGRPGVPAGRAVTVQDQTRTTIRRQYSHLFTPSVRFRRS